MDGWAIAQTVLETLARALLPVLLGVVTAAVAEWWKVQRAGKYAEQIALAESFARTAVKMAEQMGISDSLIKTGRDKKYLAIQSLERMLYSYGIKLDLDTLADLIESAVLDEFNRGREAS